MRSYGCGVLCSKRCRVYRETTQSREGHRHTIESVSTARADPRAASARAASRLAIRARRAPPPRRTPPARDTSHLPKSNARALKVKRCGALDDGGAAGPVPGPSPPLPREESVRALLPLLTARLPLLPLLALLATLVVVVAVAAIPFPVLVVVAADLVRVRARARGLGLGLGGSGSGSGSGSG